MMRMYGRLALHAESVVLPLLASDAPVVTWWHGATPEKLAYDALGVLASRRVTDATTEGEDAMVALKRRAKDYAPGDTDLAWTRTTVWRAELASAFDTVRSVATSARVVGQAGDPATLLLAGWLSSRFGVPVPVEQAPGRAPGVGGIGVSEVSVTLADGGSVSVVRKDARSVLLERAGQPDNEVSLTEREPGELLAEELRRLDADQPYADALGVATGIPGLADRPDEPRKHIWLDPMQHNGSGSTLPAAAPRAATAEETDTADSAHGEGGLPG
jgi:glucose-6-phosphate dehydrogenase assembly protein OpcA